MPAIHNGIGTTFRSPAFGGGAAPVTPDIIQEGLIWHLDAGNPSSYSGTGTTWTDLKGSYNGTLTNGAVYDSDGGGNIQFDGIDDYVSTPITNSLRSITGTRSTLAFWFKTDVVSVRQDLLADYTSAGSNESCRIEVNGYGFSGSKLGGIINSSATNGLVFTPSAISASTWYYAVILFDGTDAKLYVNNVLQDTTAMTERGSDGTGGVSIGRAGDYNGLYMDGNIAQVQCYNRALDATEIEANYNVHKARYGY